MGWYRVIPTNHHESKAATSPWGHGKKDWYYCRSSMSNLKKLHQLHN